MFNIPLLYMSKYVGALKRIIPIQPMAANIRVTENCNSRCTTCTMWRTRHTNELSTEELQDSMIQMKAVGIRDIRFTGGEPLLRQDMGILVRKAHELGFRNIIVQTNGLLLSRKARELVESGITKISVSIDGINQTNNDIRGLPHSYDAAIDGIHAVNHIREEQNIPVKLQIATTLTNKNMKEVPELLTVCRERGATWSLNLLDQHLDSFQGTDISALVIDDYLCVHKTIDYLHSVKEREPCFIKQDNNALEYAKRYYTGCNTEPPCIHAYISVFLGSTGDVYSGCWTLEPVGNVRETPLKTILSSKPYRKRAETMLMRKCPGCTCGYNINVAVDTLFSTLVERLNKKKAGCTDTFYQ